MGDREFVSVVRLEVVVLVVVVLVVVTFSVVVVSDCVSGEGIVGRKASLRCVITGSAVTYGGVLKSAGGRLIG